MVEADLRGGGWRFTFISRLMSILKLRSVCPYPFSFIHGGSILLTPNISILIPHHWKESPYPPRQPDMHIHPACCADAMSATLQNRIGAPGNAAYLF